MSVRAFFRENPAALVGAVLALVLAVVAIVGPQVTSADPNAIDVTSRFRGPSAIHPLGTDDLGRDTLARIVYGSRTSLVIAFLATLMGTLGGHAIGLLSGFVGGWLDALIMRVADIQLSFPAILIALILLAVLGQGTGKIIAALVTVQWAYYARTVRSAALVEREKEYIEAAKVLALPRWRVVVKHLLPNCLPPLIVVATVQVAHAIALEATLSFLGLGLPITEPSLGLLIANGFQYLMSGKY